MGSGCDTVGSVAAPDARGPGFESRHQLLFLNNLLLTFCRKDKK